jgi:aldehyde:ferredoxin oxidoreductase
VGTCWACSMSCFSLAEVSEGKYAGVKASRGNAPGLQHTFGAKCAIDNVQAIWKCKELCQQLGMDYGSVAGCLSLAMELFQRGIITAQDTGGLELSWGNEDAIIQLLQQTAVREGLGNILAEGSTRAAALIGKGAAKYVMAIKGMEMMASDPRATKTGNALGNITDPRGGDNVKSTHSMADEYNPDWWLDQLDMFDDVKRAMYCTPPEQLPYSWEGKAMMCKWFEDLYSALNALGVCIFPSGFILALGPTHLAKLLSACTGWDMQPEDIMRSGEKVFNLLKAYNVRLGLSRQDDAWPDRFYEESLPEGPAEGARLSREAIGHVLDEYYELRGWDKRTGLPTKSQLTGLGLGDMAEDLWRAGKIS